MKKILAAMAVMMVTAVVSSAASFLWGTGTDNASFGGAAIKDGTAIGHLVYLGTTDNMYSISDYTVLNPVVNEKASTSTGFEATKGRITGNFGVAMADPMPNTTDHLADGSVFGMYITWKDADGKEWINVASNTYTVTGLADDSSILSQAAFDFNFDQSSDGTLTPGGGWVAIPEPATATLALAGVAMLFRRRK